MIDWPSKIVDEFARRRVIPYLGAGVSRNSKNVDGKSPKIWKEFLQDCLERVGENRTIIKKLVSEGNYLDACYYIKKDMGTGWLDYLEAEFNAGYLANDLHRYIYRLDCPICITTNFDKIYDTFASAESAGSVSIKTHESDDLARMVRGSAKMRVILKTHGTIDTPHRLVFARDDYANLLHANPAYIQVMNALILTNTIVFIGCGGNDPDLLLLLEKHAYTFKISSPHYLISSDKNIHKMRDIYKTNFNTEIITYKSDDGHKELYESMKDLVGRVEKKRDDFGERRQW